ncbi:Mur ligase domain-containing protein, partial [Aeromicrobium sp.]|uniref:Mur ligase domain-containing protein n=1 Tax=Aeromicrobium sp. TaxID=1871063 RepID=UPI0028B0079E
MIATTLAEIAAATDGRVVGDDTLVVDGPAVIDSRRARPGSLFVAVPGEHVDGHDFADSALDAGAVASLGTREVAGPHVIVQEPVAALGALAADRLRARRELDGLSVIAVTGS